MFWDAETLKVQLGWSLKGKFPVVLRAFVSSVPFMVRQALASNFGRLFLWDTGKNNHLENLGKYHFFRQLWLVLGIKLMEINSNWFSRQVFAISRFPAQLALSPKIFYNFMIQLFDDCEPVTAIFSRQVGRFCANGRHVLICSSFNTVIQPYSK